MIDSTILERYSLFNGLDKEQIESILPLMAEETYSPGEDIISEETQNCKICFILEGRIAAIRGGIVLEEMDEGAFFGEMEVLDVLPSAATVKALAFTRVLVLSIDALGEIYETDLKTYSFIIMNLARDLSRRLRRMNAFITKESPLMDWG